MFGSLTKAITQTPCVTCIVIDGAVVVQMLKPKTVNTFNEYALQVVIPYIKTQLQNVERLHLVWDMYICDSLKATTKAKRGKGVRRRVGGSAHIPRNWQDFLRVDQNKDGIFPFLSRVISSLASQEKEIYVTVGGDVYSS